MLAAGGVGALEAAGLGLGPGSGLGGQGGLAGAGLGGPGGSGQGANGAGLWRGIRFQHLPGSATDADALGAAGGGAVLGSGNGTGGLSDDEIKALLRDGTAELDEAALTAAGMRLGWYHPGSKFDMQSTY